MGDDWGNKHEGCSMQKERATNHILHNSWHDLFCMRCLAEPLIDNIKVGTRLASSMIEHLADIQIKGGLDICIQSTE